LGIGGRAVSDVSGATLGVGNVGRGDIGGRLAGVKVGNDFAEGSVAADGVLAGTGVFVTGGAVLRGAIGTDAFGNGVGLTRTGIDGDGRTLGVIETAGVGLAALVSAAVGDAAGDGLIVGATLGDRCALGEGEVAGLAVAAGAGVGLRAGATVALAAAVAAGVVDAAALGAVSAGGTNLFGGALGGGVASALIFVRARSAAERSETEVQPLSTFTSVTRSFTRRGRKTFRTSDRKSVV